MFYSVTVYFSVSYTHVKENNSLSLVDNVTGTFHLVEEIPLVIFFY